MMNKFLSYQDVSAAKHLNTIGKNFPDLLQQCAEIHSVGAMQYHLHDVRLSSEYSKYATCNVNDIDATVQPFQDLSNCRMFEKYLSDADVSRLEEVYLKLYSDPNYTFSFVPRKHLIISYVEVFGEHYLSKNQDPSVRM